ncbi:TPA: hypothetical protein DCW32_00515 [Candidatus Woesebacteria bacterium]|nr:hypothetical protein [Candidatus Woesebacteria bacterium]HCC08780.1 hypothetical protein [Candidatus Woesebacteria bacterium]
MSTINISLPDKLKEAGEDLVKAGFYSSFSDLVRDSLRNSIEKTNLDQLYLEAKKDLKTGKATVLKNKGDVEKYMKSIR